MTRPLLVCTLLFAVWAPGCGSSASPAGLPNQASPSTSSTAAAEPASTGLDASVGQSTSTAAPAAPSTTALLDVSAERETTLPPAAFPSSTSTAASTTTLPLGPPDPTDPTTPGRPLHLTITDADLTGDSDPYDATLGVTVFHVAVGAIVRFVMTPSPDWHTLAGRNFEAPAAADISVLEPVVDRGTCTGDSVCATFAAVARGTALVESAAPAGCGTEGCIASGTYRAKIIVGD